ncbi:MAG: sugar ABC transporter ATP-binding protein [Anaerolineae bacterium]|nr:sugar ABC transporter ATP-binding protein [Anaerolineae bacterium]MCB0251159.1 sugar ABC transporter ATP-binding protein [Anaerolineae bacterium]MCB9130670.1 sugar ABC transporter ATP-binding protein [Anaerolineales bacterium]
MISEADMLLQIRNLLAAYEGVVALNDVSFDIAAGEVHAVLGEDGAGKTTLMKVVSGYIPAGGYSGQILLNGQPLLLRSIKDGLQHGIAMVPRKISLFDNMSVAENITMTKGEVKRRFTFSRRAAHDDAAALLNRWEIAVPLDADVRSLSPLQRRQVMIASALAVEPQLLALDEPLAGMPDARSVSVLVRMVRRIAEGGVACLFLAARPADATLVADAITVLRDGELAGQWRRDDFDEATLAAAMASQRGYDPQRNVQHEDFAERPGPLDHWFKGIGKRP